MNKEEKNIQEKMQYLTEKQLLELIIDFGCDLVEECIFKLFLKGEENE